jgi:hypothetical protein
VGASVEEGGVRVAVAVLLLLAGPAAARAQSLQARLTTTLQLLEDTVAASFGRSVPFPSASAGVQYTFDPVVGNFQRTPTTFGQVYLDRADPLGKGRVNVSASYAYLELDTIDGKPSDDLRDTTPIPLTGKAAAITIPRFFGEAAVHQVLLALAYGVTDDLEASIALPLVYSDLRVGSESDAAAVLTTGELVRAHQSIDEDSHPFAQGDLQLRAKYRVLETSLANVATALVLRIPTGSQQDLQGIGFLELAPSLLASTRIFQPATWARLQGHLNATAGFDTDDVDSSEIRWGLGLDWGITQQVTAAIAVLGRNPLARVAPAGVFTFNRCTGATLVECATQRSVRRGAAPLFGLDSGRFDYYDLSLGGRAGLWRDTVFGFVNVVVPLNDGFVRTEPIPIVGFEGTF